MWIFPGFLLLYDNKLEYHGPNGKIDFTCFLSCLFYVCCKHVICSCHLIYWHFVASSTCICFTWYVIVCLWLLYRGRHMMLWWCSHDNKIPFNVPFPHFLIFSLLWVPGLPLLSLFSLIFAWSSLFSFFPWIPSGCDRDKPFEDVLQGFKNI